MDLRALQRLALDVAKARSIGEVLEEIVSGLGSEPGVALARIWLVAPGDICETCPLRAECPDQTACLHLAASAGQSAKRPAEQWTRIDGNFRRFPLGVRKVGRIGATGEPELLPVDPAGSAWLAQPEWAASEGIRTFAGQPLVFRDEVLGVLGVFSRSDIDAGEFEWLRTFADHAAVAIANARAFEEVQELRQQLELERDYLREEIKVVQNFCGIVGDSPPVQALLHQIEVVAPTDATVLIEGESGTGKELIACAIHDNSPRRERTLVRVNCASVPKELYESEFFGHVQGSFTGATRDRAGRFQVADGGTLFLDELAEIPLELQSKLLRALQEGQFSRVGEDTERKVDVRVVAATNRNLQKEVAAGRFREDLYYRLTVFPIRVPPLRDRLEDVPLLAAHFLELKNTALRSGADRLELRNKDLETLQAYDWPGNIRELQNVIERSVIGARGGRLAIDLAIPGASPAAELGSGSERRLLTDAELRTLERENALAVLDHVRWKIAGPGSASEILGLKPATLASRLKAMGIERPRSTRG